MSANDEVFESRVSRMFFGGFSSCIAIFVTHPLDVIKLNIQVKPLTMWEMICYHYTKDRGITRIYRGISGSMCRSMVYCNVRFELYELARRQNLLNSFYAKLKAASISGALGGFLATPLCTVHVRRQNDDLLAPHERRYYKSLSHGLHTIYREEGIRMMFACSVVSSFRGMMVTIGQLALYDEVKNFLLRRPIYFQDGFQTYVIASVTAGVAATLLQQPFEVVSTKLLMNAPPERFDSATELIRVIARRYGIAGFYKGLVPGFVRIVTQTVVTYVVLENLRLHFGMLLKGRRKGELIEIISIDERFTSEEVVREQEELKNAQGLIIVQKQ